MTRRILQNITHSIIMHVWVLDEFIHFALVYITHHIFPFLTFNPLINQYDEANTLYKLLTGSNPSVSNLRVILFPCVVRKVPANNNGRLLNMRHQSQKAFRGIFAEITQQKMVPHLHTQYTKNSFFIWYCIC